MVQELCQNWCTKNTIHIAYCYNVLKKSCINLVLNLRSQVLKACFSRREVKKLTRPAWKIAQMRLQRLLVFSTMVFPSSNVSGGNITAACVSMKMSALWLEGRPWSTSCRRRHGTWDSLIETIGRYRTRVSEPVRRSGALSVRGLCFVLSSKPAKVGGVEIRYGLWSKIDFTDCM